VKQQRNVGNNQSPIRRRDLIALLGTAVAWPRAAAAQGTARRPIVGLLSPVSEEAVRPVTAAFRARLAELGYVEGRDVDLATRYATRPDRDAGLRLGAELLALPPAVVVAVGFDMTLAVHQLTSSVPVVFTDMRDDPVALGLAASFPHPGGNMTGFMISSTDAIAGKQLALLKEMAPSIVRVDALLRATDTATPPVIAGAGRGLNLTIRIFPITRGEELAPIIAGAMGNTDAFLMTGPLFASMRNEIVALVAQTRLPAVYGARQLVAAGGLMSYGRNDLKIWAGTAEYVAKILGGAKPGDLPIQTPALYELVINAKTAKALGLPIPPLLLARADDVIE